MTPKVVLISRDTNRNRYEAVTAGFSVNFSRKTFRGAMNDAKKIVKRHHANGLDVEIRYFVDGCEMSSESVSRAQFDSWVSSLETR